MTDDKAISNGPNARPRDANIGSTSSGLPNDSSRPVEISAEEERRIAENLTRQPSGPDMPYDVTHAEPGAVETPLEERRGFDAPEEGRAAGNGTSPDGAVEGTFKQGEQELGNRRDGVD